MSGEEIKQKIKYLNDQIEFIQNSSVVTFILNPKIMSLQSEISKLQKQCPHMFVNHACLYCNLEEHEDEDSGN